MVGTQVPPVLLLCSPCLLAFLVLWSRMASSAPAIMSAVQLLERQRRTERGPALPSRACLGNCIDHILSHLFAQHLVTQSYLAARKTGKCCFQQSSTSHPESGFLLLRKRIRNREATLRCCHKDQRYRWGKSPNFKFNEYSCQECHSPGAVYVLRFSLCA